MTTGYVPSGAGPGRDLAFGGMFGAAALVLPFFFHVLHLGHFFMPMYIPLMALPFFVRPLTAALTGLIVPLLSALLTGMPPLFPPVAPVMALEIGAMAGGLVLLHKRWPTVPVFVHLLIVLVPGRLLNAGLLYLASFWLDLPAVFIAGISFVSGWPGVVLMLVVIPPIARVRTMLGGTAHV